MALLAGVGTKLASRYVPSDKPTIPPSEIDWDREWVQAVRGHRRLLGHRSGSLLTSGSGGSHSLREYPRQENYRATVRSSVLRRRDGGGGVPEEGGADRVKPEREG